MKRTNFFLKESQLKLLEKEKEKTGVPSSELVRRLIDKYFDKNNGDEIKNEIKIKHRKC